MVDTLQIVYHVEEKVDVCFTVTIASFVADTKSCLLTH